MERKDVNKIDNPQCQYVVTPPLDSVHSHFWIFF